MTHRRIYLQGRTADLKHGTSDQTETNFAVGSISRYFFSSRDVPAVGRYLCDGFISDARFKT